MNATHEITNALTIDVEDYFHVWAFQNQIDPADWDSYECRIEANVERLLELFDAADATATFFWLGWAAQRLPRLVARVSEAGQGWLASAARRRSHETRIPEARRR